MEEREERRKEGRHEKMREEGVRTETVGMWRNEGFVLTAGEIWEKKRSNKWRSHTRIEGRVKGFGGVLGGLAWEKKRVGEELKKGRERSRVGVPPWMQEEGVSIEAKWQTELDCLATQMTKRTALQLSAPGRNCPREWDLTLVVHWAPVSWMIKALMPLTGRLLPLNYTHMSVCRTRQ